MPCNDLRLLPATHRISAFDLPEVLIQDCISPTACDVFYVSIDEHGKYIGEELCYLFYGRNEYRPRYNGQNDYYLPVCFVFDCSLINADVAFPFDTGGYADERYKKHILPTWDVNRFQFTPSQEKIIGFVQQVYGSNENYLQCTPKIRPDIQNGSTILNALLSLYLDMPNENYDKRANSIELISRNGVSFEKALRAIILPAIFYTAKEDAPYIKKLEQERGVKILLYENGGNYNEEPLNDMIKDKLKEYYQSIGLLSEYDMFD